MAFFSSSIAWLMDVHLFFNVRFVDVTVTDSSQHTYKQNVDD
jgi:hypothetical protein